MAIALQLLLNSLVAGSVLALMALGFHLAFRTAKVFHLAHGAVFVAGGYAHWSVFQFVQGYAGWALSIVSAIAIGGALAWAMNALVYQRLSAKGAGQEISLVASMGLFLFVSEGLAWAFGNQARVSGMPQSWTLDLAGVRLSPAQLQQALFAGGALLIFLRLFSTERSLPMRAVMSQSTVATVMGVNANAVKAGAMVMAGMFAGLAGSLVVVDTGIHPHTGLGITLSAAVAVILGGARSFMGTIIAALALALVQTMTEWFLSAAWKEGITFLILIVVLLWKTEGIIAFNLRPEER